MLKLPGLKHVGVQQHGADVAPWAALTVTCLQLDMRWNHSQHNNRACAAVMSGWKWNTSITLLNCPRLFLFPQFKVCNLAPRHVLSKILVFASFQIACRLFIHAINGAAAIALSHWVPVMVRHSVYFRLFIEKATWKAALLSSLHRDSPGVHKTQSFQKLTGHVLRLKMQLWGCCDTYQGVLR